MEPRNTALTICRRNVIHLRGGLARDLLTRGLAVDVPCLPRLAGRSKTDEKDRGDHQAVQTRRSERSAARGWSSGHYGHRGEGLWATEGPHRTLPRRGVCRGLPPQ